MKKILIAALATFGVSNASAIHHNSDKLKEIANIDESTPLVLEHSNDYSLANEKIEVAYHYSHRSHYSHYSHRSHYSHYSSRW